MKDHYVSIQFILTVLFICLKVTGTISWSWIWVLCPLWIGFATYIAVLLIMLILCVGILVIGSAFEALDDMY